MDRQTAIGTLLFCAIVAIFILFIPRVVHCEPKLTLPASCDPKDPTSCVQPLIKGEMAPFTGQLMSHKRAAKLGVAAGMCKEEMAIEVEHSVDLWRGKLETEKRLRSNDENAHKLEIDLLIKQMYKMEKTLGPNWYERPSFVIPSTIVLTIGTIILSTWILNQGVPNQNN